MISETNETAPASAPAEGKGATKAHSGARRAHRAAEKGRAGKRAVPAKKAHATRRKANRRKSAAGARKGSKSAKVLELLRRPGGVTGKELTRLTGWQAHSVRGFLSGVARKKMGLTVVSTKGEDGERVYSVKA